MFERSQDQMISRRAFLGRMAVSVGLAGLVVACSLGIGVAGYHWIADLGWIDSILNAAMILTGMGPVDQLHTDAAKLFASAYALFSGIVFLSTIGIVAAPLVHRLIHRFHAVKEGARPRG
ncbi:MAG: hypothetical protein IPJ41_05130 [Phycisphaerales bacterium]|nr:hypothetical protein [Phycisphaerales bacterium]